MDGLNGAGWRRSLGFEDRGNAGERPTPLLRPRGVAGAPVCSFDVCAPVVSVPGFEPRFGRAHRSEAFVALLGRANVEPVATIAWALVATGLRFDWSPPVYDGANAGGHGWGSVMLRLRLRLDAGAHVVVPPRPR